LLKIKYVILILKRTQCKIFKGLQFLDKLYTYLEVIIKFLSYLLFFLLNLYIGHEIKIFSKNINIIIVIYGNSKNLFIYFEILIVFIHN
jgi:nicotinic acid phosphoribosyltransferase